MVSLPLALELTNPSSEIEYHELWWGQVQEERYQKNQEVLSGAKPVDQENHEYDHLGNHHRHESYNPIPVPLRIGRVIISEMGLVPNSSEGSNRNWLAANITTPHSRSPLTRPFPK